MTENTTTAAAAATLGPLNDRAIMDAIRGSYDLGYNDARTARTVPGDSAPGYKGRDVECDHGGALIHTLSRRLAAPAAQEAEPAKHPDDHAVDRFAAAMKSKLAAARAKGRGGWETAECTQDRLSRMLREHVEKGDPRDVANFCVFLWNRGESIVGPTRRQVSRAEVVEWLDDLSYEVTDKELDALFHGAAAQADAGAVPEGWRLVPMAPTLEMGKAAADAWLDCGSRLVLNKAASAARAAIAAAPQAPAAASQASGPTWEALHHAWQKIGADLAGLDWGDFTHATRYAPAATPAPAAAVAPAAAPTQEADGWMPIETAPDGERVLLGPRHAPVVGMVHRPAFWEEEQEPTATVVHYNGNVLVAGYRCSEWHRLPDARARQEGGGA
ncbi:hypothetical protein C8245_21425 [Paracidovorax avenae]|uniref:hypothetical protein n=1 Tax=Paracidovorax avenae TaxID=80867 RepID=UPI000D220324|nr:hypothetical protein [Paracidovorax avenae]AVS67888.1 hypothetical protein C8245_21425 [Paracidovorax avenae]